MPSPFPGMDPYLEEPGLWPDVHNTLIVVAREFLVGQVKPKYFVRIEERVYLSGEDDPGRPAIIPDIRIGRRRGRGSKQATALEGTPLLVAEPEVVTTLLEEDIHEPRLEIRDRQDKSLVTVIEVLSPTNKIPGSEGRLSYQQKRAEILRSPSHWVEIDLLRTGTTTIPRLAGPYDYLVHVSRVKQRPSGQVWRIELPQRLPVIPIPLKPEDGDALLDLQRTLDTAYDRSGYDAVVDYRRGPEVPLTRERAKWASRLLREKGQR